MQKLKIILQRTAQIFLIASIFLYVGFKVWIFTLTPDPPPIKSAIRPEISQIMWAVAGEKGKEGLEHSSALLFFPTVLWVVLTDGFDLPHHQGDRIINHCIKSGFIKIDRRGKLKWHFTNLFLADGISSYWSYDDVIRCKYDYGHYGKAIFGFESAAEAYFSKKVDRLTLQELLAIELMGSSPYLYDPCNPKRAAKYRKRWLDQHQKEHAILQDLQLVPLKMNRFNCQNNNDKF